jgi:hypothetical protein
MPDSDPPRAHFTRRGFLRSAIATAVGVVTVGGAYELIQLASPPLANGPGVGPSPRLVAAGSPPVAIARPSPLDAASPRPAASGSLAPGADRQHFRTRPDLTPPIVHVAANRSTPGGHIFFTPANGAGTDGPAIVDTSGELVWARADQGKQAANLSVATYRGQKVMTWWEGTVNGGNGNGEFVIVDSSYRELMRVRAHNGYAADLHEFVITPEGTALFLAGNAVQPPAAASSLFPSPGAGASASASSPQLWDDVIQEVDLASGGLVFEWHSAAAIDIGESYIAAPTSTASAYDYVHANSIDVDTDGNLLVSARNTCAVYKVDRGTGKIIWRLGGRRSDFTLGEGAEFAYQHDARRRTDGRLTIFDDQSAPATGHSRAIVLRLDETAMTATLEQEFLQPEGLSASSQGNAQWLVNGDVFVGWGAQPYITEFGPDGSIAYDAAFPAAGQSYRSFRFDWTGRPTDAPIAASHVTADGSMLVYASWNGATEVAAWEALAGSTEGSLGVAGSALRTSFETTIDAGRAAPYVAVRARDASGTILGTSAVVTTDA